MCIISPPLALTEPVRGIKTLPQPQYCAASIYGVFFADTAQEPPYGQPLTGRPHTENAMLASAIINQRLLEHLNTGILLLDSKLNVLYMNPAAEADRKSTRLNSSHVKI